MNPSSEALSPLRQRMIDDMRMRKLERKMRTAYLRAVMKLAKFLKRSPDTATVEDLRRFQLYLVDHGTSPITINATICGLKFFFGITLGRSELMAKMQTVQVPQKLPVVLSRDEVARLTDRSGTEPEEPDRAVPCLRHRAARERGGRAEGHGHREGLQQLHRAGRLQFFGERAALQDAQLFDVWLAPTRRCEWVVYAKRPFAGPQAVLAYLSRYTHRVAISNGRLVALDARGVSFRWKDYRAKDRTRHKTMTLAPEEFMRRFLLHVLPSGFHRIRHYGLLANGNRRDSLVTARTALHANVEVTASEPAMRAPIFTCWHCGGPLLIVDILMRERPSMRAPSP
jgi:hypothetical protein